MIYNIVSWNRKQIDINLAIPTIVVGGITFQDMIWMEENKHFVVEIYCASSNIYNGNHNVRFVGDCGGRQALLEICSEWMGYPPPPNNASVKIIRNGVVSGHTKYDHSLTTVSVSPITPTPDDNLFDFRKKYNINFDLI